LDGFANKKKLAERTKANDDLQKLLGKTKNENAELQQKVKELEVRLAELEPQEEEKAEEEQAV
jgi:BMFP domain-containing protein YqiC